MLDSTKFVKWFKKKDNDFPLFAFAGLLLYIVTLIFFMTIDRLDYEIVEVEKRINYNNERIYEEKHEESRWKTFDYRKEQIQKYELENKELTNELNSHKKEKKLFFIKCFIISLFYFYLIIRHFIINSLDKTKEWTNLYYHLLNTINKENKHFNKDSKYFIVFERSYEKKYSDYEKTNTYLFLNVFYIHVNEQDLIFQKFQLNFENMTTLEIEKFSWPRNLLKSINQNHFENYIVNLDTNQKHSFEYFSNLILENKLGPSVIMPIFNPLTEQELYDYSKLLMKHES